MTLRGLYTSSRRRYCGLLDSALAPPCLAAYDALYAYASTSNNVQDIEALRKALNTNKLNFYMASYGTRLGLAYLVKYPQHVQRIILDGNIAPANTLNSLIDARADGAVATFNAFFQYCAEAGSQCVLNRLVSQVNTKSSADLIERFNQFMQDVSKKQGVPTSPKFATQPVTSRMIANIVYSEMQPSNWKNLAQALYNAEVNNSGDGLMQIYMASTGYDPIKESYPVDNNATASAVICADYVIPSFNQKASWLKFVKQIESQYSSVGTIAILWLSPMCVYWPVTSNPTLPEQPVKKFDSTFPQVLIIGNSEDPMTPFHNALAVKAYLNLCR